MMMFSAVVFIYNSFHFLESNSSISESPPYHLSHSMSHLASQNYLFARPRRIFSAPAGNYCVYGGRHLPNSDFSSCEILNYLSYWGLPPLQIKAYSGWVERLTFKRAILQILVMMLLWISRNNNTIFDNLSSFPVCAQTFIVVIENCHFSIKLDCERAKMENLMRIQLEAGAGRWLEGGYDQSLVINLPKYAILM